MPNSEGAIFHRMFSGKVPAGKVRWWVDDGQGGGWIEYVTPEEAAYREQEQHREEEARREAEDRRAREDEERFDYGRDE
jgi:hypothetical protein